MPVFNGEAFIGKALDSLANQSRAPDRVIVVDDASSDRSAEVATAAGAECITVETNRGPSHARNRGLAAADDCDAVLFLDADDWLEPWHLERLEKLLLDFPECAVAFAGVRSVEAVPGGGWRTVSEYRPRFEPGVPLKMAHSLFFTNRLHQSGTLARRQPILDVGGYDEDARFSEDYLLWCRIALDFPFVCTTDLGTNYRVHTSQATSDVVRLREGACRTRQEIWRILKSENRFEYLDAACQSFRKAWLGELRQAFRTRNRPCFNVLVQSPPPKTGNLSTLTLRTIHGPLWRPLMAIQWTLDRMTGRRRP